MRIKLKGKIVIDSKGVQVYPKGLTYFEMLECLNMKHGSVESNGVVYYPPFTVKPE